MNNKTYCLIMALLSGKCAHVGAGFINVSFDRTGAGLSDQKKQQLYEQLKKREND